VEVANARDAFSFWSGLGRAWPALLALVIWIYAFIRPRGGYRTVGIALGWTLLAWAALRWPNGANLFFPLLIVFLLVHVLIPAARVLFQVPRRSSAAAEGAAPATAAFLLGGLLFMAVVQSEAATQAPPRSAPRGAAIAESVIQEVRIEEKFALATAKIRWHATKDQALALLSEPAVLTRVSYPTNALRLVQVNVAGKRIHQVLAQQDGSFDLELQYQLHVVTKNGESGFVLLPTSMSMSLRRTPCPLSATMPPPTRQWPRSSSLRPAIRGLAGSRAAAM
jgi:hypothetical protein